MARATKREERISVNDQLPVDDGVDLVNRIAALLFVALLMLALAPRLPAPISEETTPTVTPRPMPAHLAATARKSEVAPTDVSMKARESRNGGGTATVFIYRSAGLWGKVQMNIDGTQGPTIQPRRYSVRTLGTGKHAFEATGGFTHQRVPIEIDLQGDQKYYLRMSLQTWSFPEAKIIFTRVPSAQGVEEIAKLTQAP